MKVFSYANILKWGGIMEAYSKRLVEVDEVLNHLTINDYSKIPYDIIRIIKENKDTEYKWSFNENKRITEQNLNRDTIAILSYINMEYLLNQEQKEFMKKVHESNEKKSEEQKRLLYNVDNIFKDKNKTNYNKEENIVALVECQKITIFNRIKSFLKKLFSIK